MGDLRAALAILVKEALGQDWLDARQDGLRARALSVWMKNDRIELLGNQDARALPIFSFRIRDGRGGFIHHQFFTRLLSDATGIQARGGCACAGPYGHRLLGLGQAESEAIFESVAQGEETAKPGWVRLNLSPLMSEEKVEYIVRELDNLARMAPEYVSRYTVDPETARFKVQDVPMEALTV